MPTDAELRMVRRLVTKKSMSVQNIDSVLALVPAMVEEIERRRAAASPLNTPGIDIGEAEDLVLQLGDWLNHEAMDSGDPGGKLRDFAGALTRLLGQVAALRSHPPLSAEERGVLHRARNRLGSDAAYAFRAGDDVLHEQIEQEIAAIDRVTGVESDADAAKLLAASETQGESK